MTNALKAQLLDWKYTRGITLKFLSELSDDDLDKKLPRKNLNTIRAQIEELAWVQQNFIDGIVTKKMDFSEIAYADKSKQGLAKKLAELDDELMDTLKSVDGTEMIDWYGEQSNIHGHISSMIGHEYMHIGQIVAFCYATGIDIPAEIVETMALDG